MSHETPNDPSPRPNLAGLRVDALMASAIQSSDDTNPWPEGFDPVELLGRGGMGEVYLANDLSLGRQVAVKLLRSDLSGEPMFLERLEREARLMSTLNHSGVVVIHRFERLGDTAAAIIMEYVGGGNLRDLMTRYHGRIPPADAARIARETALAIAAAHRSGVVHRDLKPENILLTVDGHVKVTDFGLAAPMNPQATRLTLEGNTSGTLDYMAPERLQANVSDPACDIYSLGVVLYEMLVGSLPRGNFDSPTTIRKAVPAWLSAAAMRAMKSVPRQRFNSMQEFAAALKYTQGKSSKKTIFATAGVILLAISLAALFILHDPPSKPVAQSPPVTASDSLLLPESTPSIPPATDTSTSSQKPTDEEWRDLLATAKIPGNIILGGWSTSGDGVVSDDRICILKLADDMPDSYDVRMTFTRLHGIYSIALFFRGQSGNASIEIDGWGKHLSGVQAIDGRDLRNGNAFFHRLVNGEPCELYAEIRPDSIRIEIDGVEKANTPLRNRMLSVVAPWDTTKQPAALAIGSYLSPTRFVSLEWRPAAP